MGGDKDTGFIDVKVLVHEIVPCCLRWACSLDPLSRCIQIRLRCVDACWWGRDKLTCFRAPINIRHMGLVGLMGLLVAGCSPNIVQEVRVVVSVVWVSFQIG